MSLGCLGFRVGFTVSENQAILSFLGCWLSASGGSWGCLWDVLCLGLGLQCLKTKPFSASWAVGFQLLGGSWGCLGDVFGLGLGLQCLKTKPFSASWAVGFQLLGWFWGCLWDFLGF